ncbi:MAG: Npun_F0813 family protein [Cyanobacteria bacterium P01_A01_bin.135]
MFILKREDVEISSIQHPKRDQKVPVLHYQGQTFRLINIFGATQSNEARALWRELTDNRGKACVLLEEPERYSIWGKVRLEQLQSDEEEDATGAAGAKPVLVQACLLLLQAVYIDIEDLLGDRQLSIFEQELLDLFKTKQFPGAETPDAANQLLTIDPLATLQVPPWREGHLTTLLQELHRLGKEHFGNANFTQRVMDALEDMPSQDRGAFMAWLKQSPAAQAWQAS